MSDYTGWILEPVKYDETYLVKDVLNLMFDLVIDFVSSTNGLELDYGLNSFRKKFHTFIYNDYYLQTIDTYTPYDDELHQYFTSKYSDEIHQLYEDCKDLSSRYNLGLFHKHGDTYNSLENFLFDTLLIEDPYYDEEDTSSEQENLDYTIDESYL